MIFRLDVYYDRKRKRTSCIRYIEHPKVPTDYEIQRYLTRNLSEYDVRCGRYRCTELYVTSLLVMT